MSFWDFFKVNPELLTLQSKLMAIFMSFILVVNRLNIEVFNPDFSKKQLQININTASKQQLEKVPYIGKETAELIIQMRQTNGQFNDINQLKFLTNFAKFKYYIKTED